MQCRSGFRPVKRYARPSCGFSPARCRAAAKRKSRSEYPQVWRRQFFFDAWDLSVAVLPLDSLKTRYQNIYLDQSLNRYTKYELNPIKHIRKVILHEGYSTFGQTKKLDVLLLPTKKKNHQPQNNKQQSIST